LWPEPALLTGATPALSWTLRDISPVWLRCGIIQPMRFGLCVIAALVTLGLVVETLKVRGSKDERSAIRHALKAPLSDLGRRDSRALCDDFTPTVDVHLAAGQGADCESNVTRMFRSTSAQPASAAASQESPSRLRVMNISWHGNRATAASVYLGVPGSRKHWRLDMLDGRWRIDTPAKLEVQSDCRHRSSARPVCVQMLAMHFAQP